MGGIRSPGFGTGVPRRLRVARTDSGVFLIGLLEVSSGFRLSAASVIVGLLGLVVLVDGALPLAADVEDLANVNVRPDLDPLVAGVQVAQAGFAEGIGGGLVVLLVEECLAHAEVGQRVVFLHLERALVLLDGLEVAALLGELFAAGDRSAYAQPRARLQDVVVWVDGDAAGLRPAERLDSEVGIRA